MIAQVAAIVFGMGGGLAVASLHADLRQLPALMRQLRAEVQMASGGEA